MKTALVTGASSEIGLAVCLDLGAQGYKLICQYSENERVSSFLERGISFVSLRADFQTQEGISGFIDEVNKETEVIDVIVHCAAQVEKKLQGLSEGQLFNTISYVNMFAPILITKALVGKMKSSDNPVMIFISSTYIKQLGSLRSIYYSSTKSSLPTMSRIFAQEYLPVRSNVVTPGYVDTGTYRLGRSGEKIEQDKSLSLNKRLVTPEEVAKTVSFIVNNKSMNGANIYVDGGLYI